jgi:hypothetical protein
MVVLPCIASLIAKKKGNQLYYYVVESARVDGKPQARWTEGRIRNKIQRWLSAQFLADLIHYQEELRQIQQFVLLYPPQGEKGPNRAATVLSKQTLPQQALAKTLGLEQLRLTPLG